MAVTSRTCSANQKPTPRFGKWLGLNAVVAAEIRPEGEAADPLAEGEIPNESPVASRFTASLRISTDPARALQSWGAMSEPSPVAPPMDHNPGPAPGHDAVDDAAETGPIGVSAPSLPTERIGKYEVVALLGRGGMGAVYQAFDPILEREVAVKVMLPQIAEDPEQKQRFEREARAIARLTHANVVTVFDLGYHTDGAPYIVMELLVGKDLLQLMHQDPPLHAVAEDLDRDPGAQRPRPGPQVRDRPPRHQARQRLDHRGRRREDHGLRDRPPRLRVRHRGGLDHRDRCLHVPGAGPRRAGGWAERHLQRWLAPVRAGHRQTAFRGRDDHGHAVRDRPQRAPHRAARGPGVRAASSRPGEGAGQGPGGALRRRPRSSPRPSPPVWTTRASSRPGDRCWLRRRATRASPPRTRRAGSRRARWGTIRRPLAWLPGPRAKTPTSEPANPSKLFRLLREVYVGGKSGHLHFTAGRSCRSLRILKGQIIYGTTDADGEHLGDVLVRYGMLSEGDRQKAVQIVLKERRRLGEVLVGDGLLEQDRLEEAIGLHVREILFAMLEGSEGSHSFEETSEHAPELNAVSSSPPAR